MRSMENGSSFSNGLQLPGDGELAPWEKADHTFRDDQLNKELLPKLPGEVADEMLRPPIKKHIGAKRMKKPTN